MEQIKKMFFNLVVKLKEKSGLKTIPEEASKIFKDTIDNVKPLTESLTKELDSNPPKK